MDKIMSFFCTRYRIVSDDEGIGVMIQIKMFFWPFWNDVILKQDEYTYRRAWFSTLNEAKVWLETEYLPSRDKYGVKIELWK